MNQIECVFYLKFIKVAEGVTKGNKGVRNRRSNGKNNKEQKKEKFNKICISY